MPIQAQRHVKKSRWLDSLLRTFGKATDSASAANLAAYFGDHPKLPAMGSIPAEPVFEYGKLSLVRVQPKQAQSRKNEDTHSPILVIPPLMVRPYIYDLRPEHSMLGTLRDAGFDVFVADFGVPDRSDENTRLDDYVLDYVPKFVQETLRVSGASRLGMVGYCMGGLFSLLHVGTWGDERVGALVTLGSPVNFKKMGLLTLGATLGAPAMDKALDWMGNVPGALSSLVFKLVNGPRAFTRYLDLVRNLHDEDYVRGFLTVNHWVNDMIPYPREAFRQMFKEIVFENGLPKNELQFGGRRCDLRQITCPLLAFAAESDRVATPASTREIVDLVSSEDKTFRQVSGGHVAVVAGRRAPSEVWFPMANWLKERRMEAGSVVEPDAGK